MKLYKFSLALLVGLSTLTSCEDKLDLTNPNQQTTGTFGNVAEVRRGLLQPHPYGGYLRSRGL